MATRWGDTLFAEKSSREGDKKRLAYAALDEFRRCYEAMDVIYREYDRCKDFVSGDQWGDMTVFEGMQMTEQQMMELQGRYAVVNNFLKILIRNYKGTYIKQDLEATCRARQKEFQPLADALSTSLQYLWDLNSQKELNSDIFEEGLIAPCFVGKVSVGIMNGQYDVWSEPVQIKRWVVDSNTSDPRGFDIEIIGEIHDMSRSKVISTFAKSPADRRRIGRIYDDCSTESRANMMYANRNLGDRDKGRNFYFPTEWGLCRVYEIWKKEYRDGYECHDYLDGGYYSASNEELAEIKAENEARCQAARMAGVPEEEIREALSATTSDKHVMPPSCKLIRYQYFYEDYWYYRFMAPNGEVICEGESPYEHKSHPYVFRIYPLMGGAARSFINDVIDLQKDINRMDAMYDWIIRHAAKGALLMPRDQMDIEHGWNLTKYGKAWARPDAVIPYNPKPGAAIPQQISKNNTDIGIWQSIQQKAQWIQDITGVQGSLQGKTGYAGTSGTLYAQQVQNASTSLLDLIQKFSAWTKDLAMKQLKCMQQVYDEQKFIDICGSYGATVTSLRGIKRLDVYTRVDESAASSAYRSVINDELKWMVEMGMIDINTYLNNTTIPFDWKLQSDIAQAASQAVQNGQQPLPTSVPQTGAQASISGAHAQGAGDNSYNRSVSNSANARQKQ